MRKHILRPSLLGLACLAALLYGCAGTPRGEYLFDRLESEAFQTPVQDGMQLILTHSAPAGSLTDQAAQLLKEKVELASDKTIQIEIYPEDSLGNLDDGRWYFSNGSVDMRLGAGPSATASVALWLPLLTGCTTQDVRQALRQGEPLQQLICQPEGDALVLGVLPPTARVMTANCAVDDLSDLSGLTMRVFRSGLEEDFWQSLGAKTVVLPIGETYLGLQQGVADAQENPIYLIRSYGLEQQQTHLIPSNFKVYLETIYINSSVYRDIGAEKQDILDNAVVETCREMESITDRYLEASWDVLQKEGVVLCPVSEAARQRAREKTFPIVSAYLQDRFGAETYRVVLATMGG